MFSFNQRRDPSSRRYKRRDCERHTGLMRLSVCVYVTVSVCAVQTRLVVNEASGERQAPAVSEFPLSRENYSTKRSTHWSKQLNQRLFEDSRRSLFNKLIPDSEQDGRSNSCIGVEDVRGQRFCWGPDQTLPEVFLFQSSRIHLLKTSISIPLSILLALAIS